MDYNHTEIDSIYHQLCGHIEWFNEQSEIIQRHQVKTSLKDQSFENYSSAIEQFQNYQTQKIHEKSCLMADSNLFNENSNTSTFLNINDSKKKFITKTNSKSYLIQQKQKTKHSSKSNSMNQQSQVHKKSKFNNMGGFLIGTFSDILNMKGKYRFVDGIYQIFIHSNWVKIGNVNSYDVFMIEKEMTSLKFKLSMLPRKEGAKKDLFKILNDDDRQSEEIKLSKFLLRKQILYSMGQRNWLLKHVNSRDFKPENDDRFGTKKRERHEAYLSYLIAIEFSLRTKNKLTKRISV